MAHDREVLRELVAVARVEAAADVLHQLVEARGEVRLALGGLAEDDLVWLVLWMVGVGVSVWR